MPMDIWRYSSKQYEMVWLYEFGEILSVVGAFKSNDAGSILDGIQIGLGIISAIGTCIPGIGWGVAVVANVLDASISVAAVI